MCERYKSLYRTLAYPIIKQILEQLLNFDELVGKLALDAGCGWGWFLRYASEQGIGAYGLELNSKQLKNALAFGTPTEKLLHSDMRYMPFRDGSFDLVFCWHVIEHISNCEKALKEVHRVLKRDGLFIVGVPNEETVTVLMAKPFRWLKEKGITNRYIKTLASHDVTHLREFTVSSLLELLKAKFHVTNIRLDILHFPFCKMCRFAGNTKMLIYIGRRLPAFFRSAITVVAKKP